MTSNINIDASAITNRVDVLQQSVLLLQSELVGIRQIIPTNLPEFTEPVPVNIQNAAPPVNFTGVEALLVEIKAAIENLTTSSNGSSSPTTSMFQSVAQSSITASAANWNVTTPTGLTAITDGDSNTATTWGHMQGGGNRGWFQFDMGSSDRRYIEAKIGIRMAPGHEGGNTEPFIEVSDDGVSFVSVFGNRSWPSGTERVLVIPFWCTTRYLRVGVLDNGGGQPQLKVYDLKAWKFTI